MTQLAEAVEYTDCISAEGSDSSNMCPAYDTKQSGGEALWSFGKCRVLLYCHCSPVHSGLDDKT